MTDVRRARGREFFSTQTPRFADTRDCASDSPRSASPLLVAAAGLSAALPVVVSTARALFGNWTLEGDQAIIATRAFDVLSSRTPLVGPWSTSSSIFGDTVFSPGPLLYWLLAIPTRLFGAGLYPVVMGAVNVGAVVGIVALANRRAGAPLMFATALAVALMTASLQTEVLREVWAPSAPVLLFGLLIFLCWSVACGDGVLLAPAVLVGSFAMQCHLIYVGPVVALLVVAVASLAVRRRLDDGPSLRRWTLTALVVGLLAWSAPLIDQGLSWAGSDRAYGNLQQLVDAAQSRGQPVGKRNAVYALSRAIGAPPWWLRAPQQDVVRVFEIFRRPSVLALLSAALVLVGLVVAGLLGARTRRWDVAAGCALALALCGALTITTAAYPNEPPGTVFGYAYASRLVSPIGMWTWLILGWSVLTLWRPRLVVAPLRRGPILALGALATTVLVSTIVSVHQGPDSQERLYEPVDEVVRRVEATLSTARTVRVDGANLTFGSAVTYALRRRGATVRLDFGFQFGRAYELSPGTPYDRVVDVRTGREPPAGARLLARVRVGPPGGDDDIVLSVR